MKEQNYIVKYQGKEYPFEYGSQAYIFDTLLYADVTDAGKILEMVEVVHDAYLNDDNRTPLGALTDYVAENWDEVKDLSKRDLLNQFYVGGYGD